MRAWVAGWTAASLALAPAAALGQAAVPVGDVDAADPPLADDPANAPIDPDARASLLITQAREQWRVPPAETRCAGEADEGEILVCARSALRDQRIPGSSAEAGSRAALRDGMPRAPQLDRGSCKGQPGCIVGGWAPPPVYMIDLKAIPEAPEGSDADKVARGEMSDR